jgi:hypothetical protein
MSRFFLLIFLLISCTSYAADKSEYLVEDVAVSITGKSPNEARNSATASARRDAFLILLTRLGMKTNTADSVSNDEISEMVRSEQIDNEKIAGNNYSATFNIMFAKDFVDHILNKKNVEKPEEKKVEEVNESYVLIPAKTSKRRTILWEENNDWKKAVEKSLSKKKKEARAFIIPDSDMANISVVNRDNVEHVEYVGLEPMLSRYKSGAAYILLFNYDEIENKVNINVSYIRKLQKKQFKLSFINVDLLSYEALIDKVADKTIEYLLSNQTSDNKVLSSNLIRIQIPISGLGNWIMVKNKIEGSNLVNQLNIESISRDFVLVSVNYLDARVSIEEGFSKIGLRLNKQAENFYVVSE